MAEYIIEEKELKKISLGFRRVASRLLNTEFRDGINNLKRFINYIDSTTIIKDFIEKNTVKEYDIEQIIKARGFNEKFNIPCEKEEEISFTYQLLKYMVENVNDYGAFAMGYSFSNKFQDMADSFNDEVVKPFVNHIIEYLEVIKIDMGIDEKAKIDISISDINGSQINVAQGKSTINAVYNGTESDIDQIRELTETIFNLLKTEDVSGEILDETEEILDTINEEVSSEKPKKSILKYCNEKLSELSTMTSNSVKIGASIATLIKLIEPFIA